VAKKKAAAKASANRALLAKELLKLIPKIDEEGLAFLIKQSHTIIYNLHVDEMNKALKRVDRLEQRATGTAEKEEAAEQGAGVEDAPGGKSFVLVLGATRKILSRVELQKLVAIAKVPGDDAAHSEQLYAWLQKHRGDVLFDGRIGSRQHPLLAKLARYLRTHYTVKK
jgi:hypothetical protein